MLRDGCTWIPWTRGRASTCIAGRTDSTRCLGRAARPRYVNSFARKKMFDATRLLRCSWSDMLPSEEDLIREPLLRELALWPSPSPMPSAAVAERMMGRGADTGGVGKPGDGVQPGPWGASGEGNDGGFAETKGETKQEESKGQETGAGGAEEEKEAGGGAQKEAVVRGKCIAARFELLQLLNRKLRDALPYLDLRQVMIPEGEGCPRRDLTGDPLA